MPSYAPNLQKRSELLKENVECGGIQINLPSANLMFRHHNMLLHPLIERLVENI